MSSLPKDSSSQSSDAPFRSKYQINTDAHHVDLHRDREPTNRDESQGALSSGNDKNCSVLASSPLRLNKYRGSASTWRNWTAPERELAISLDKLTANNLSLHLYNVFKLKEVGSVHYNVEWPVTNDNDVDMDDAPAWVPPRVWTDWPLRPEVVPREEEESKWGETCMLAPTYAVKPKLPGDLLRELLEAEFLRRARLKFVERASADREEDGNQPTMLKPVAIADDERASQILKPTIQSILAKLDDLLVGLHHARSAYSALNDSGSESRSQTRGHSMSRARGRKRRRAASRISINAPVDSEQALSASEGEATVASKSFEPTNKSDQLRSSSQISHYQGKTQLKSHLSSRNWSDVLGVASMTGWDSSVINDTASRCSSLFGEGITLRTLKEGCVGHTETFHQPGASSFVIVGENARAHRVTDGGMNGGVHVDGFIQPVKGKKSWKRVGKSGGKQRRRPRSKA